MRGAEEYAGGVAEVVHGRSTLVGQWRLGRIARLQRMRYYQELTRVHEQALRRVPEQQEVQFEAQQRTVGPRQQIDENCKQPEGS